ncbi:MAG: hypothetical protein KDE34_16970 [Anaerolineales bacterium]|nr:hypothetical protein [Anaerolineales bacterium]
MRRTHVLILLSVISLLPIIGYFGFYPRHQPTPHLIIDASVDDNFAEVITETWIQFLFAFAARSNCFGDVLVKADYDLVDRAMYDPRTATVSVRVPERASILKGALVHEWAHHVEFQCAAQTEMRAAFIEAQGIPADTLWRLKDGTTHIFSSDWANIPSEQYAETVIVVVLGERPVPTNNAPITTEGVEVIRRWAQKENLSCSPGSWACPVVEFIRQFTPGYLDQQEVSME